MAEPITLTIEWWRNLETGLVRSFWSPPRRGKWERYRVEHIKPATMHVGQLEGFKFTETKAMKKPKPSSRPKPQRPRPGY